MQKTLVILLLLSTTALCYVSCRKDIPLGDNKDHYEGSTPTMERTIDGPTVLGAIRQNPYAVAVIQQAYNNLYEPDISSLQPNYLYVRFLPQTPQDVKLLLDSHLSLWDFPLHYDIVSVGDYYHDPSVQDNTMTWQYTVVPIGYAFPNVQHEILEQLALVPEDSRIAEEAFRLTNNTFDAPDVYEPNPDLVNGKFDFVLNNDGPIVPPPASAPSGPCGCPMPDDVRKPSGCVTVFDNMLNLWEGVREVEVIVAKSRFFGFIFHRKDYTDAKGCFLINHKYKGSLHAWVKFESATANIKTMKGSFDLWGYTFPRRAHIGKFNGPNFSGMEIKFNWTNSLGTEGWRNWVAATTNNSIYEFQGYCSNNNLPSPPGNLKVLITPWGDGNTGAAPMFDKFSAWNQLIGIWASGAILGGALGVLHLPTILAPPIAVWLGVAAPDIVYNANNAGRVNADQVRETLYHELSHTLHFNQVGDAYWLDEIQFTIENSITGTNPPYGNGGLAGAGRCAIVESWGFQVGMISTHERYGLSHSNGEPAPFNTWEAVLERNRFVDGYIPFGWHHDLRDDNPTNPVGVQENGAVTSDRVFGFTQAQIFSSMTSSMLSPGQQRAFLAPLRNPAIPLSTYNGLGTNYGF